MKYETLTLTLTLLLFPLFLFSFLGQVLNPKLCTLHFSILSSSLLFFYILPSSSPLPSLSFLVFSLPPLLSSILSTINLSPSNTKEFRK